MTKDVIVAHPNESLSSVREKIEQHKIHHMPVVEEKKVVGMISMNDIHSLEHQFTIFNNPEAEVTNRKVFSTMLAKDIMKSPVVQVKDIDPASVAVDLLLDNFFHALPVVDKDGNMVGIVTTFDLIKHALGPSQ